MNNQTEENNFTVYKIGKEYDLKSFDEYHWNIENFDWISLIRLKYIEKWESFEPVYGKTEYFVIREDKIIWKGKTKQEGVKEILKLENRLIEEGVKINKRAGRAS